MATNKKQSKQTKLFKKKHLSHTITSRRKHQAHIKKGQNKQHRLAAKGKNRGASKTNQEDEDQEDEEEEEDDDSVTEAKPKLDMSVDALLNPQLNKSSQHHTSDHSDGQDDDDEDEDEDDDLESIESLEDGSNRKIDFKMLKEKDPDFYKFLEENDKALLDFDGENESVDSEEEEEEEGSSSSEKNQKDLQMSMEDEENPSSSSVLLTKELLRTFQKAILENKSIRALRKILLAFKSAAFSSSSTTALPFSIESSSVFNAVVNTALRYLPVFLNQTLPAKELPNGKFKIATNSKIYASMQRMLKSYFTSLIELISQVPSQQQSTDDSSGSTTENNSMLHTAVSESSKLIPWITGNRKLMRTWIKTLLELWSSSSDKVRLAAILSLRRIAVAADSSTTESIMKGVYTSLIRSSKNTTVFTLPLINLMKNSGSNIFLINLDLAYPIVFSYIRQLAIHLRNSMKLKSKEGFQAVYNWQFIHSLNFWSLVLSSACSKDKNPSKSKSSSNGTLDPLIYPLVQITIGVIKLVPTTRYFPLRFHCVRLLLRLIQRTDTFIPLAPFLLDPLDSPLFKRSANANNKAKPLDFEYVIRCPKSHESTRVYAEGVAEETIYLLLEYHACLGNSVGFPELVLPGLTILRKLTKTYSAHHLKQNHQKLVAQLKTLVQKIEAHQAWIIDKRKAIPLAPKDFGPNNTRFFIEPDQLKKSPLSSHLTLQAKIRAQKQAALDRSAHNDIEID